MKKEDRWKFEETFLNSRFDAAPAYRSSTITSLEQFIQQLPPSLLAKSTSRKSGARQGDDQEIGLRVGHSKGGPSTFESGNGFAGGANHLRGFSSQRPDMQNKWFTSVLKEKPVTGSVLKCPLSGITIDSKGEEKQIRNAETTKKLFSRKRTQDKKNTENKITSSKSASNMAKLRKPLHPQRTEISSKTMSSPRSRSCSHCLPESEGGCDFDAILARLMKEKEKRLEMESCVEGLKNEVSLNQQEVQSLIQSKKTAVTVAKVLKRKFEKANITNKEALRRVKALKAEKAELAERLKKEGEKLEALAVEVSALRSGQSLRLQSSAYKIKGQDVCHNENETSGTLPKDELSMELLETRQRNRQIEGKLSEAAKKVRELKSELEKKKLELENIKAVEEEKERDILKDPKVTQYVKEKEQGLKKRINILTALEAKQKATVVELRAKLTDNQQETSEMRTKLENEIFHLKTECTEQKDALMKEKAEKEKFKSLASEYNRIIKFRNERITELSKVIEDQEQTIESAQKSREKEELLMKQIEKENAALRHHIDNELNPQITEMHRVMEELKKSRQLAEAALQDLQQQRLHNNNNNNSSSSSGSDKTVCGKNCSSGLSCEQKLRCLRESLRSREKGEDFQELTIGDHKDAMQMFPVAQEIQKNEEISKIINQRKKLQKDLDSVKEEKNKFYCDLKELQKENNEMVRRIGDLSTELEKAKTQAAAVPQQESKLSHLEAQLRISEKEWVEKWEKAKQEKEEAIETAKNVTDKLVNCVASYQYETANLKKVQCMLVNLLNQKDAMLAICDQKLQQASDRMLTYDHQRTRTWLPIQSNAHVHR